VSGGRGSSSLRRWIRSSVFLMYVAIRGLSCWSQLSTQVLMAASFDPQVLTIGRVSSGVLCIFAVR